MIRVDRIDAERQHGYFITVCKDEALVIIKSLVTQILEESCCTGRAESRTIDREYFTIAVDETIGRSK